MPFLISIHDLILNLLTCSKERQKSLENDKPYLLYTFEINEKLFYQLVAEIPWALRFIEEPADTQFAHTRSAILDCKVEDRPKATITWKIARSDHVINSNITGIRHILPNGSLYFPAFTVDNFRSSVHRADYQCIAKNNVGNFEIISRIAKLRAGKQLGRVWGLNRREGGITLPAKPKGFGAGWRDGWGLACWPHCE